MTATDNFDTSAGSVDPAARLMRFATYASVTVAAILIVAKLAAWSLTGSVALLSTLVDSLLENDEIFVAVVTPEFRAVIWAVDLATGTRELLPGPSDGYPLDVNIDVEVSETGNVVERHEQDLTV